jgi:F0F1-type ATP synthase epsilon subunit
MSDTLHFSVLTPDGPLADMDAVKKVRVRLVDGALLSVYPYHAPLIAETMGGEVTYVVEEQEKRLRLRSGIFFVCDNSVTLYTGGEIDSESPHALAETEEYQAERFDRLAATLMSTLRAHPQRVSGDMQPGDSEL